MWELCLHMFACILSNTYFVCNFDEEDQPSLLTILYAMFSV
uniref:Uncharacterized protein n=1 Tax=Anguilla anguilla TaxID=7936 RepID=A0A0E9PKG0_ANGAN